MMMFETSKHVPNSKTEKRCCVFKNFSTLVLLRSFIKGITLTTCWELEQKNLSSNKFLSAMYFHPQENGVQRINEKQQRTYFLPPELELL